MRHVLTMLYYIETNHWRNETCTTTRIPMMTTTPIRTRMTTITCTDTHSHEHTKAVLNRLSRALGHLESVKRMVEDGRDCAEVLIQLAAVRAALGNTAKVILKDHIEHCIVDAAQEGDMQALADLNTAIERFMQ